MPIRDDIWPALAVCRSPVPRRWRTYAGRQRLPSTCAVTTHTWAITLRPRSPAVTDEHGDLIYHRARRASSSTPPSHLFQPQLVASTVHMPHSLSLSRSRRRSKQITARPHRFVLPYKAEPASSRLSSLQLHTHASSIHFHPATHSIPLVTAHARRESDDRE